MSAQWSASERQVKSYGLRDARYREVKRRTYPPPVFSIDREQQKTIPLLFPLKKIPYFSKRKKLIKLVKICFKMKSRLSLGCSHPTPSPLAAYDLQGFAMQLVQARGLRSVARRRDSRGCLVAPPPP